MLWGQRGRQRTWGQGRGGTGAGDGGEARVGGQDLGAGRPHPLPPPPLTRETHRLCSWFWVTCSAPGAVCMVDAAGAGRVPALLGAPGQRAKAAGGPLGGCWGEHGDWNLGGLSNGVRGVKSAGWEPASGHKGGFSCSAAQALLGVWRPVVPFSWGPRLGRPGGGEGEADMSPREVISPFPTLTATHRQLTSLTPTDTQPQPPLLRSLSAPAMGAGRAPPTAELPSPQFLSLVPLVFQGTCQWVPSADVGC